MLETIFQEYNLLMKQPIASIDETRRSGIFVSAPCEAFALS